MAGGKMTRRTTRSSAGGGRGSGTKKLENTRTSTPRRVSFSPQYAEDSDDSDFTPVSVPVSSTPLGRQTATATPTPSSVASRLKIRGTPYPYPSPSSSKLSESDSQLKRQKRRRSSKTSRSVFPACRQSMDKKRPQTTLTAQLKYMMEVLPEKVQELKSTKKMCYAERNRELGALEENLMERIAVVGDLNMKEAKEVTRDRQQEVLDMMTESLESVQDILNRKKEKLETNVRPGLRASFNSRFVCCPVCAEKEKRR